METMLSSILCRERLDRIMARWSGIRGACGSVLHMKSRNSAAVSDSQVDRSRFELFLNVFVRTPARGPSRRASRRR